MEPFDATRSPPVSPSSTIPAFRGDGWDGHAHSAPPKSVSPLTPGAVARLKGQLEARINEEHRSRSVEPARSSSPSPMRMIAQDFQDRINRTSKSPSPTPRSPRPRASSPLKKDSRITDAFGGKEPAPEVSGLAAAAAKFGGSPQQRTPTRNGGGLVPLSVTPTIAARFERGRAGSRSPLASVDDAAQKRRAERMAASMPSTSEALREIEAAMRGIEAAHSPKASAAAAAQLRTYDNSFWEPEAQPGKEAQDQRKEAAADKKIISEQKPRPSAAKALFPISGGSGEASADVGHILPRQNTIANCEAKEPATPEKAASNSDGEEEAFPQTPSSLKSAVWGSKLWPAHSPASLAPAGATSSMQPFDGTASLLAAAAHPAITTDTGAPDTDVAEAAAAEKGQKAAAGGKPEKSAFNVSASCVRAQPAAPAAPNKVQEVAELVQAEEEDEMTCDSWLTTPWIIFMILAAAAQLALLVWVGTASWPGADIRGVGQSPPWYWRFPPLWQFESPPFWGRAPPPQWGFYTDEPFMTNADLHKLVHENETHEMPHTSVWNNAVQGFNRFSEGIRRTFTGLSEASSDQEATSDDHKHGKALAIIPRPSGTGAAWLRGLIRRLQGAMTHALPLPAAQTGQPKTAEPEQDAAAMQTHALAQRQTEAAAGSSIISTVLSFLGALAAEMLGLYLLTRLALYMMAGKRRRRMYSTGVQHSKRQSLSQLWQREPWA